MQHNFSGHNSTCTITELRRCKSHYLRYTCVIIKNSVNVGFSQISTNVRGEHALVTTVWPYASTLTEDSLAPVRTDTWEMASTAMVNMI